MRNKVIAAAGIALVILSSLTASGQSIKVPDLKTIQNRYKDKWPGSLTFMMHTKSKRYGLESDHKEYHAYQFPVFFRIDQDSLDDGNARVSRKDTVYYFRQYKKNGYYINDNYVSGYMLGRFYFDSMDQVYKAFSKSKIDLNQTCSGIWQGRQVFVYGASTLTDTYHTQVWYDARELYPVRFIDQSRSGFRETRYNMKRFGEVWFPVSATEYTNGKQTAEITYTRISIGEKIAPEVFSLEDFGSKHWFAQP